MHPRRRPAMPLAALTATFLFVCLLPAMATVREDKGRRAPDPEELRKAAEAGNLDAMYHLGLLYKVGQGVDQDTDRSLAWFRRAAEEGHAGALYEVGRAHLFGKGAEVDTAAALAAYHKAAEGGHRFAIESLGHLYLFGEHGVEAAPEKGVEWLERAYGAGSASAARTLGEAYEEGTGVEEDAALAEVWYRRAAERGDEKAKAWLEKRL